MTRRQAIDWMRHIYGNAFKNGDDQAFDEWCAVHWAYRKHVGNIPDLINDFLIEIRERDGFANDKNFDQVAAEVFKRKIMAERERLTGIVASLMVPNDAKLDLMETIRERLNS